MSVRFVQRIIPKTADYTINPAIPDSPGTVFTNRGATGAVVFTLPEAGAALKGWWYDFLSIADQTITVKTATADTLVVLNDAAADSLAMSTGNQKIGSWMRAICDGTAWIACGVSVGTTFTVAT